MVSGMLRNSPLAPLVQDVLRCHSNVEAARSINWHFLFTAIASSDEYFVRVFASAGMRDWQRDIAPILVPTLVGVARSLRRSPEAQLVIKQLCDAFADRLRLKLEWPSNADEYNDQINAIYAACLRATNLESDGVLMQLKGLPVVGPT